MELESKSPDISYNIFFTDNSNDDPLHSIEAPAIVFSPINNQWNDFRHKCRYKYVVISGRGDFDAIVIDGEFFLGFTDTDERIDSNGVIDTKGKLCPASDLPPFFSLLGGMAEYRSFISENGLASSNQLLLLFNDLVALRRRQKQPEWIAAALKTKVFKLAFMRNSEPFFAFHNADSLLGGLDREEFGRMSTNLSLSYRLNGFSRKHELDLSFSFDDILPKRITVLIGRNGLGKSQALASIVRSLVKGDSHLVGEDSTRPMISRVLAIATPGETTNTFPPERNNKRIRYKRLILNRTSSSKSSRGFGEMCVQLARSEEHIGTRDRWGLFTDSVSKLDQRGKIVLPLDHQIDVSNEHTISIGSQNYIPIDKLRKGGEQAKLETWGAVAKNATPLKLIGESLYPLSSGQSALLKFSVQACLFIENGTLVLLDEPETHLHPNFVSEFVRLLNRLLEMTGSAAVIATHSAYFVREMPRTQVLVFRETEDEAVNIDNPRLKTFGADIGSISYFVFEDEITNVLVEDLIDRLPQKVAEKEETIRLLEEELSTEVIMYLRRRLGLGGDFD
jgi:predicted ATPase